MMKRPGSYDAALVKVEDAPRVKRREGEEEEARGEEGAAAEERKDEEEGRTDGKEDREALVGSNAKDEAAAVSSEREEGELEPENGEKQKESDESEARKGDEEEVAVAAEADTPMGESSGPEQEKPPQWDLQLSVEREKAEALEERGSSPKEGNPAPSDGKFFMRLSGRERDREETKEERRSDKKQRVEDGALLSLALPDTSLSLSSGDPRKQRRAHSQPSQQGPAHSRAFTDSLSLSHSQPFQHNPSCSLTQTELSSGSQQISVGKEQASYGSWQRSYGSNQERRPKPLYQKVLSNPQILQGSLGRGPGRERGPESVENSQAPVAMQRREQKHKHRHGEAGEVWSSPSHSGDSRETQPHSKAGRNSFGQREKEAAGSEREFTSIGVQDIVSEPIPSMARKLQELPDSFLAGLKESLREMLNSIEKREQFVQLQQTLAARTDLTTDVLLRAYRIQLELLVAVKTGILAFLHSDIPMTHSALVEVFLQQRCRNFACQNQLPADECDCKLCAQKAGFCNSCMCVVCSKFDFDANTCRWIGCDFCLHWCHTDCGIRMSYITPGPSIRGAAGTTEMQFHCVACGHTSELYGFVKDVFCTCAPEWGRDVLARELDCVRRIFHGSTDTRGKQLCNKAEVILQQLNQQVDTAVACRSMIKFFDESGSFGATSGQAPTTPSSAETKKMSPLPFSTKQPSTQTTLEMAKEALATYDSELEQKRQEASELQQERERKKAQIEELESIVRIKQAEAKMFAVRADEARREAEGLHRIMLAKAEKIEQEYAGKLSKLGMADAEDRCRKHNDTVQVLQQAQMDFRAMNQPLLNELHELLKQLEASKRHSWK